MNYNTSVVKLYMQLTSLLKSTPSPFMHFSKHTVSLVKIELIETYSKVLPYI